MAVPSCAITALPAAAPRTIADPPARAATAERNLMTMTPVPVFRTSCRRRPFALAPPASATLLPTAPPCMSLDTALCPAVIDAPAKCVLASMLQACMLARLWCLTLVICSKRVAKAVLLHTSVQAVMAVDMAWTLHLIE